MSKEKWSDWLDYNQYTASKTPETSRICMKILFIGGSRNMKKSIEDITLEKCISKDLDIK